MNYRKYRMSLKELLKYGILYGVSDAAVSILFYRSWIAFLLFLPGVCWFIKENEKALAAKQKKYLEDGFLQGMRYVVTELMAGSSVENAFVRSLDDLRKICRDGEPVLTEFVRIINGLRLNRSIEDLLLNLSARSGVEDIQTFAEVFAAAKRTGGDLIAVIQSTEKAVSKKQETKREIEVCLAAKKMEQNVMSIIPCLILFYVGLSSPGFLDVMYGNLAGVLIMSICLCVYVFAFVMGRKIVNIEV